jgi:methylthioribose-1-phosphate isomerase
MGMPIITMEWRDDRLVLLDQTLLPAEVKRVTCSSPEEVREAIRRMVVRGAPAIGVAAAFGVVLAAQNSRAGNREELLRAVEEAAEHIGSARPTAVNLFWALERMKKVLPRSESDDVSVLKELLLKEAHAILNEDRETCRRIGVHGAELIKTGDAVLTHCNAGGLATSGYGTALAAIFAAREQGKEIKVYVDETRPRLQGARLTAWELKQAGIETTVICDNMAGLVMKEGKIDLVITGADRIARNGDSANKIGTYSLALLAEAHDVPFYVAAPKSSFDMSLASGDPIPIEQRDPEEVTVFNGKRIAPEGVKVYNPAFDVTPHHLIWGIITEEGLVSPPYENTVADLFG